MRFGGWRRARWEGELEGGRGGDERGNKSAKTHLLQDSDDDSA